MTVENDLCVCGHQREHHQQLLGAKVRYPCLQCTCANFRERQRMHCRLAQIQMRYGTLIGSLLPYSSTDL